MKSSSFEKVCCLHLQRIRLKEMEAASFFHTLREFLLEYRVISRKRIPLNSHRCRNHNFHTLWAKNIFSFKTIPKFRNYELRRNHWKRSTFPGVFHQSDKNVGYKAPSNLLIHYVSMYTCVYFNISVVLVWFRSGWNKMMTFQAYNLISCTNIRNQNIRPNSININYLALMNTR